MGHPIKQWTSSIQDIERIYVWIKNLKTKPECDWVNCRNYCELKISKELNINWLIRNFVWATMSVTVCITNNLFAPLINGCQIFFGFDFLKIFFTSKCTLTPKATYSKRWFHRNCLPAGSLCFLLQGGIRVFQICPDGDKIHIKKLHL